MKCTWKFWVWGVEGKIFQPASFNHYSDSFHIPFNRKQTKENRCFTCIHLAQQTPKACNSCLSLKSLNQYFCANEITSQMAQHSGSHSSSTKIHKSRRKIFKNTVAGSPACTIKTETHKDETLALQFSQDPQVTVRHKDCKPRARLTHQSKKAHGKSYLQVMKAL